MIIKNEKDRLKAMRILEDAELPIMIEFFKDKGMGYWESQGGLYRAPTDYPDTPEPELGSHNSGMEAEEYW